MARTTAARVAEKAEDTGPLDPSAIIESFTGWEEIAIEAMFGRSFATMGESTLALRVVEFVANKRRGIPDRQAYKQAMDLTYKALVAKYDAPPAAEDGDGPGEA